MNPSAAYGLQPSPAYTPPVPPTTPSTRGSTDAAAQSRAELAASKAQRAERVRASAPVVTLPERMRIEVEWHAASLSYVHRILDPSTGKQLAQLPVAQVLDLVDDLMKQIQKG